MTDLAQTIADTPLADTHEHLYKEDRYVDNGPDILGDLFAKNYILADLEVAGAAPKAVDRLLDSTDPDVESRWEGVSDAWKLCRHTGYGEAVQLIARHVYGIEELTVATLIAAQARNREVRLPGERLRILREEGNLDHVQVDDLCWECLPDRSGLDFFLYDLSWRTMSSGDLDLSRIRDATGVSVTDLDSLEEAMAAIFETWGGCAISVKSQHAYDRTLRWRRRSPSEVRPVLKRLVSEQHLSCEDRLCLGDWCLSRGTELAIRANLPIKLHTGYCCRVNRMVTDHVRPGNLCELLIHYPGARFVLMHAGYPYLDETIAIAKHFPNVYVDMCWAWSINPYSAMDFLRRMIHAVPINRLFAFGGDTIWPNAAVAYARQARHWLTRALQAEVADNLLSEAQAMEIAAHIMIGNQHSCFDIAETRRAIQEAASRFSLKPGNETPETEECE